MYRYIYIYRRKEKRVTQKGREQKRQTEKRQDKEKNVQFTVCMDHHSGYSDGEP